MLRQDKPGAPDLVPKTCALAFENVSFHYAPAAGVLNDVSFDIAGGKTLASIFMTTWIVNPAQFGLACLQGHGRGLEHISMPDPAGLMCL